MPQRQLTLRQIEIIRAIMVSGSIAGAARLLHVSQPGLSRAMKHVESILKIKLFVRTGGRYTPSPEARNVFAQLNEIYQKLNDLHYSIAQLEQGRNLEFSFGSVPSLANWMVPRAIRMLSGLYPELRFNIETLKIEEAVDYLLLERGELVCMSYRFEHPALDFQPLSTGELVCLVHRDHPLAGHDSVTATEIAQHPLIAIDPRDPYGSILTRVLDRQRLRYDVRMRVRFGNMAIKLVQQNLGVAILDSFTLASLGDAEGDLRVLRIEDETRFDTYVAFRKGVELSSFAERFIEAIRAEMAGNIGGGVP